MRYIKTKPESNFKDFQDRINQVTEFLSTEGKRYKVAKIDEKFVRFYRLDGKKPEMEWSINLAKLFQAYQENEDFSTSQFKPFVPRTHSPSRSLLIKIGLLKSIE